MIWATRRHYGSVLVRRHLVERTSSSRAVSDGEPRRRTQGVTPREGALEAQVPLANHGAIVLTSRPDEALDRAFTRRNKPSAYPGICRHT